MTIWKLQKGSKHVRGSCVVFPYLLIIDQKPISPVVSFFGMSVLNNLAPLQESSVQDASIIATPTKEAKIDPARYKTKLCKHWLETGMCPFQGRCIFSHGQEEIRTSEENRAKGLTTESALREVQNRASAARYRSGLAESQRRGSAFPVCQRRVLIPTYAYPFYDDGSGTLCHATTLLHPSPPIKRRENSSFDSLRQ